MNNLSLMIYAAEVVEKLGVATAFGAFACLGVYGFGRFTSSVSDDPPPSPRTLYIGIALALLASVMPSSRTIYMIAASEAGHAVATSEQGQEILDAARKAILSKLKEAAQ